MKKCGTTRHVTDDNKIRRTCNSCWLTEATSTLRISNTYCFYEATMVKWTRLNVTFIRILPVISLFTYILCDLSKELNSSCCDPVFVFVQVLLWELRYNKNCTTEAVLSIWVMTEHKILYISCKYVFDTRARAYILERARFAKLRNETLSFVMSVRLSVRPLGTRLPLDGFSWHLVFEYLSKICQENSSLLKIWQD